VAARPFGEPHHVDLHAGKEPLRRFIEKQQANVLQPRGLGRSARDVHLPPQRLGGKPWRIHGQRAADFLQEFLHQGPGEIIDARGLIETVIERHLGSQAEQLMPGLAPGFDRAAEAADEVLPDLVPGRHRFGRFVGPRLSARRPEHDQVAALDDFEAQRRKVRRLNQLAVRE